MKREKNYKTAKFIEALEHIDPKYVEEAGKRIKERPTGQTVASMSRAKSLRQVFALVACVLLLSAIIPAVTYLVGHLPDIIGSSTGDDTTEQTSPETPPEETSSPAPETTVTETTIEETTAEETTSEPETTECTHSEYICTENMPTCTESAIIEYGCMRCGYSWSKTEPPLGHDFKDGVCTRCGEKEPITDGSQGLEYRIEGDHAVLVGIGTCTDKEIIVASTYNGLPVTGIDSFEISGNKGITSVTVSEGVTHIEVCAFSGCPDLRAVYLPSTLQFLSSGEGIAFANCDNIDTIKVADSNPKYYSVGNCLIERGTGNLVLACSKSVLPSDGSIKSIGEFAFGGSDSLEKIVIPEGVTVINPYAFAGCASLKSVTFPDSLTTVRWDAFANCTSLESVKLGDNVTEIGSRVFSGCSSLVDITLPGRVDSFGEEIFAGCPIESIVIPDGVKTLHGGMFANCRKLKSVTLPDGIETIVGFAFAYCSSLEKITLPRSVTKIQGEVFADCSNLTEFTFKGTKAEWNAIEKQDGWNDGCPFTVVHCSDGDVNLIEYDGSRGLEYRIDGDHAVLVGIGTCTDKEIIVASTYNGLPVTSVDYSFSKISNVTSITLSDSVLTVGGIDNMPDLVKVYFSKSVEGINPESLIGCPNLVVIEVDKENQRYMSAGNCLIEKATKTIVHGCKGSVIPSDGSVTVIGEFSFHGCDWLTELTIPEGIERIDAYAFAGCDSLRRVILSDSLTYLGFGAFCLCESLESISLGNSLETLGGSVFEDCPKLMELTLPKTIKLLCGLAFFECKSLKKVSYEGTIAEWRAIEKTAMWSDGAAFTVVHCSDGDVDLIEYDGSRGLEYRIEGDHAVLVGIGTCTDKEIIVASTYNGLPVTAIGRKAIYSLDGITRVVISDTVTYLDYMAIAWCSDLESIHIPANLTTMEEYAIIAFGNIRSITVDPNNPNYYSVNNCLINRKTKTLILGCDTSIIPTDGSISAIAPKAFMMCDGIESITIPEGVTKIGEDAFYDCSALKSIELPESLITIDSSAFANCSSLQNVKLGGKVEYMGDYVFSECEKLGEIILPDSLSFLGNYAFQGCTDLKRAVLSSNLEILELMIFASCTNLEDVIIPEGVKTISTDAFSNTALKELKLPASIKAIRHGAFGYCDNLMNVSYAGTVTQWIAVEKDIGWHTVGTFKKIRCSDGEMKLYSDSKDEGSLGLEYEINTDGKSARLIGEGICTDAKIVVAAKIHGLPVTEIYSVALSNCDFIEEIVIPEGVTVIRNQAFSRCVNLKKITLPSTLEYIYDSAFADCESLVSIVIPREVKLIETWAFRDCKNLTKFTFAGTVAEWNAVQKGLGNNWNDGCPFTVIHCSDGEVEIQ